MSLIKWKKPALATWPGFRPAFSDFFENGHLLDSDLIRQDWIPAVNVRETEKEFEIELAAPGLSKKDFNISVSEGILTISSEKEESKEEEENNYTRKEFSYAAFSRTFRLPKLVDADKIQAIYRDGILLIKIAKLEDSPVEMSKAIPVK